MNFKYILSIASLALLVACGDDSSSNATEESSSSETSLSSGSGEKGSSDSKETSSDSKKTSSSSSAEASIDVSLDDALAAFNLRKPVDVTVKGEDYPQQDWVCSFKYDGSEGYFYIQASPSDVIVTMQTIPVYTADKASLYFGENVVTAKNASYDWGGNHHNDYIQFDYDGKQYKYYHSSFGFGWRSCQEMDCMEVYDSEGELLKNGCSSKRELPVICRQVNAEGKVENFKDVFEKCNGDDDE